MSFKPGWRKGDKAMFFRLSQRRKTPLSMSNVQRAVVLEGLGDW